MAGNGTAENGAETNCSTAVNVSNTAPTVADVNLGYISRRICDTVGSGFQRPGDIGMRRARPFPFDQTGDGCFCETQIMGPGRR